MSCDGGCSCNYQALINQYGVLFVRVLRSFAEVFGGSPTDQVDRARRFIELYLPLTQFGTDLQGFNEQNMMIELVRRSFTPLEILQSKITPSEIRDIMLALKENQVWLECLSPDPDELPV